jgi:hypothetical protein
VTHVERSIEIAHATRDETWELVICESLGMVRFLQGRLDDAEVILRRGIGHPAANRKPRALTSAKACLAATLYALGRTSQAADVLEEARGAADSNTWWEQVFELAALHALAHEPDAVILETARERVRVLLDSHKLEIRDAALLLQSTLASSR